MKPQFLFVSLLLIFVANASFSQKVFRVKYESQADFNVFVVKYESQCDLKVFHVDYESQADLKIYYVDYESQAGWRDKSKAYLLKF